MRSRPPIAGYARAARLGAARSCEDPSHMSIRGAASARLLCLLRGGCVCARVCRPLPCARGRRERAARTRPLAMPTNARPASRIFGLQRRAMPTRRLRLCARSAARSLPSVLGVGRERTARTRGWLAGNTSRPACGAECANSPRDPATTRCRFAPAKKAAPAFSGQCSVEASQRGGRTLWMARLGPVRNQSL